MKPNLDFFKHNLDIRKWRFMVALSALVVVVYIYFLVIAFIEDNTWRAAIAGGTITFYMHVLGFQLVRPPRLNRHYVLVMSQNGTQIGGPYSKDKAHSVFHNVGTLLSEETYTGITDAFLIQSENEETATREALRMKKEKDEAESEIS